MQVTLQGELHEATFLDRGKGPFLRARVRGGAVRAMLPRGGDRGDFLTAGASVLLRRHAPTSREGSATWSVVAGQEAGHWVLMETALAKDLVEQGLTGGKLATLFPDLLHLSRDVTMRHGSFDFQVDGRRGPVWVEMRELVAVERDGHTGLLRPRRLERLVDHLNKLAQVVAYGERIAVLLVALRDDVRQVRADDADGPALGAALEHAYKSGVQVVAWGTAIQGDRVVLTHELPIAFD